jgi:hypothetical protein
MSPQPPPDAPGGLVREQPLNDDLNAVLSIEDEFTRIQELIKLAPGLGKEELDPVIPLLESIADPSLRARALVELAPHLGGSQLGEAYMMIKRIGIEWVRLEAIGRLYEHVPKTAQEELIDEIGKSHSSEARLKGWLGMVKFLPSDKKQEAINTALSLTDEYERLEAFITLAPHVPDVSRRKFLASARSMINPEIKVRALSGLLTTLPKRERADVLDETLALARNLTSPKTKAEALLQLLPNVPDELRKELVNETIRSAKNIAGLPDRILILVDIAENVLSAAQRQPFLKNTALNPILTVADEKERSDALIMFAQLGPHELHAEILAAANKFKDFQLKSRVIIKVKDLMESLPPGSADVGARSGSDLFFDDTASDPSESFAENGGASAAATGDGGFATHSDVSPSKAAEGPMFFGDSDTFEDGSDVSADEVAANPADEDAAPAPEGMAPVKAFPKGGFIRKSPRKTTKAAAPKTPPIVEVELQAESVGVKAYLHSDRWTLDDQLNYSLYADAIAEFIRHDDTHPPLAIGILAPWGQGKTTLMKLIQNQLENKVRAEEAKPVEAAAEKVPGVGPTPMRTKVNFAYLREWLKDPSYKPEVNKLNYPIVWFNAWKYQNSEQLWAGMAYCILSQLVAQIPSQFEQEKFWLALQAERIDFNAIRRDIHRVVFERIAPWLIIWILVALLGLLAFSFGAFTGIAALSGGGVATVALSLVMTVGQWLWARMKVDSKPLEGRFAQYVRQPIYEGKLGFFHEVEEDVKRVFKLLVDSRKPVVVFIDDLDRCSPGTVAQVIEAMNLFLSADFPDCYFVVGMDAQVVAASMEVAYENLDKKLKSVTRSYGSLGWYFMDKFIQLQFNIPNMTPDQRSTYLTRLFGQERQGMERLSAAVLDDVQKKLEAKLSSASLKADELPQQAAELAKLLPHRPQVWQRLSHTLIETGAKQLSDDSPTLQKHLQRYEPFLGVSPRGIKRFANLYRFYSLSQLSRQSQGLPACSPSALARWLVIMLRWPQVVRWIQWEGEAKLSQGTGALSKATDLENELCKTQTHAAWLKYLDKNENPAEWLRDQQLYEFLKAPANADEKLFFAVQTGVW